VIIKTHSHLRVFGVAWCLCGCGRVTVALWRWEFVWGGRP
jgi:hypothetical protein